MTSGAPATGSFLDGWPPTRFSAWRIGSPVARSIDAAIAIAGAALIGVSLFDAVGSFWNNHIFIEPARLEKVAGAILIPSWPWILVSWLMVTGIPRRRTQGSRLRNRSPNDWRLAAPWLAAAGVIVTVIVVGFIRGASKGSLRILPGGVHEVSTLDLNSARWTAITPDEYQLWAARFVREDAMFALFGLALVGSYVAIRLVRQQLAATRS